MVELMLAFLIYQAPSIHPLDESLIAEATSRCPGEENAYTVPLLRALLDVEREVGVPEYAKGITLVAACRESRFNPVPSRGDGGKAAGLLQWWPWWEREYGFDREAQPVTGVRATLRHVKKAMRRAKRLCGKPRAFFYAYVWVTSGPKGWRCRYNRHVRRAIKWKWYASRRESPASHASMPPRQ